MSVITDWSAEKAAAFTHDTTHFRHALHERSMFDDDGLARTLDEYPRDKLGIFTMGEDPVAWTTWRRGSAGDLSGAELLAAAKAGRIWLNLRETNKYLPAYAELSDEIFADKAQHAPHAPTFKRDVGLLISSANAQVFYHLDVALVSLWQLRGVKRVWIYPVAEPFVSDQALERIVLREAAEQFAFDPAWDASAIQVELKPGEMVSWTQNAPHRIENGSMLNVSLSIEFMTPRALMRANVIYANGVLRRRLPGLISAHPTIEAGFGPTALAKAAIARGAKAVGLQKAHERKLPATFTLDPAEPGVLKALEQAA
ncbi:MAG: hypothetical protein BGN86_14555 [Caulobacterales bacterium 68-7]|nr:MAG: hypothetical protein BGN86_14555 [Caulobacterales bacterium 68-7]